MDTPMGPHEALMIARGLLSPYDYPEIGDYERRALERVLTHVSELHDELGYCEHGLASAECRYCSRHLKAR